MQPLVPRHGPLATAGYLKPWAERIAGIIRPEPGDVAVDVMSDSGVMVDELARAGAMVLGVDDDADVAAAARGQIRPGSRIVAVAPGQRIPMRDGNADVITSLFTLGCAASPADMVAEMRRLCRRSGRVAITLWSGQLSIEQVLADALAAEDVCSPFLQGLTAPDLGDATWLAESVLTDVARFQGIDAMWLGLVGRRPLVHDMRRLDVAARTAVKNRCAAVLAPYTSADGTMRVPVQARVLTCGTGAAWESPT